MVRSMVLGTFLTPQRWDLYWKYWMSEWINARLSLIVYCNYVKNCYFAVEKSEIYIADFPQRSRYLPYLVCWNIRENVHLRLNNNENILLRFHTVFLLALMLQARHTHSHEARWRSCMVAHEIEARSWQLCGGLISPSYNSCGQAANSQLHWRGLAVI
jgi:hypothetical protein